MTDNNGRRERPWDFNSHAHVERDEVRAAYIRHRESISTHTLTWSVTSAVDRRETRPNDFNSHAHVERDKDVIFHDVTYDNFNSHAHVERDCKAPPHKFTNIISTHTLTWSVTGVPQSWGGDFHNFNSHAHVERDVMQRK